MSAFIDEETNEIELTRGDSLIVKINMFRDDVAFTPTDGSSLQFALKKKATDKGDALAVVDIPIDTMILELMPDHTKELPFGDYVYDIQLTTPNGIVDTFITATRLTLTEEVG